MKNSILIMSIMAFVVLGCSNEGVEIIDQNLDLGKSGQMADLTQKLSTSQEFRNLFPSGAMQRNSEGNGVMILQNPWGIFYGGMIDGAFYLIGGFEGSIDLLPNGRARFSVHTNNPSAAVIDFATFSTLYSSDCIEGPLGALNYNYISEFEEVEILPGWTVYVTTGVNDSAETANGHCNVSDAQPIFDENFEITGCTDATEYKVMRLGRSGISLE